MNATIYLVACCAQKQEGEHEAKDLYISPWFKLARKYVEQETRFNISSWYILSAKHGLIPPTKRITRYDTSLLEMGRGAYLEWLRKVQNALYPVAAARCHFAILATGEYREDLVAWLTYQGSTVSVPMQGLGIGEQLSWLKKQTERANG
jgi:hypothetical protein